MILLGFDTATAAVTVAVHDGARALATDSTVDARRHGELLAPMIGSVLAQAAVRVHDVDGIAVGVGPGPYTGLRVGVVTALSMSQALGVPAYGVCTLDVIAAMVADGHPVTVVTDARRREVFWASYDATGARIGEPAVARPVDAVATAVGRYVGAGARMYPDVFGAVNGPQHPDATVLCAVVAARLVGSRGDLLPPRPIYLRRPDVAQPRPPKMVTQA